MLFSLWRWKCSTKNAALVQLVRRYCSIGDAIFNGNLLCSDCGEATDSVVCEEGHIHDIDAIRDVLGLYPTAELFQKIQLSLKTHFDINLSGSFNIHNDQLTLMSEQTGGIVSPSSIPELKNIAEIGLESEERKDVLIRVRNIKEKCRGSSNIQCNTCWSTNDPMCMMKLFTTNSMYRPSPHQGTEFGDVSFTVTRKGIPCELVGIAKSAISNSDVLNIATKPGREMIQQVLSATHDARIGIIAAICPMRFHDQLREELRYIAKLSGKEIVILDDAFMVRQYKAYVSQKGGG